MSLPASTGYNTFIADAPGGDVSDFTFIRDGSLFSTEFQADINSGDGSRARFAWDDDESELAFDWISDDVQTDPGVIRFAAGRVVYAASSDAARRVRGYAPNTRNVSYGVNDTYGQYAAYNDDFDFYSPDGSDNDRTVNQKTVTYTGSPEVSAYDGLLGKATRYPVGAYGTVSMITGVNQYLAAVMRSPLGGSIYLWGDYQRGTLIRAYSGTYRYYINYAYTNGGSYDYTSYHIFQARTNSVDGQISLDGSKTTTGSGDAHTNSYVLGRDGDAYVQHVIRYDSDPGESWLDYEYAQTSDNASFWSTPTWVSGGGGTTATPDDQAADWALGSPAVSVVSSVTPDDLSADWELGEPSASTGALASPEDINGEWALGSPASSVQCEVSPEDINAQWGLGEPTVFTGVVASPDDLSAQWKLGEPGVIVQNPASPDDLQANWALGAPAVSVQCEAAPDNIAATWDLGTPRVNWTEVIIEALEMSTPLIRDFEMNTPFTREYVMGTPVNVIRGET